MKQYFKSIAIMFIFVMQSITIWPGTTSTYPTSPCYQKGSLLGNNPKPTKAPTNNKKLLNENLKEETTQLIVPSLETNYTYIYIQEVKNLCIKVLLIIATIITTTSILGLT